MIARLAIYGVAAAAALAAMFWPKSSEAATSTASDGGDSPMPSLRDLFKQYGDQYGVDPFLMEAIGMAESNLNADAVRNNPPNDVSVGVMQILCIPDQNGFCTNRLNVEGWGEITFDGLRDPAVNIKIAAQILAWNIGQFGYPRGIAVYNSWSARNAPREGPFPNQTYVDRVLRNYARITGT